MNKWDEIPRLFHVRYTLYLNDTDGKLFSDDYDKCFSSQNLYAFHSIIEIFIKCVGEKFIKKDLIASRDEG